MAIIGGDQGKAGESKGSGRKADDLRLSCLCLLLPRSDQPGLRPGFPVAPPSSGSSASPSPSPPLGMLGLSLHALD